MSKPVNTDIRIHLAVGLISAAVIAFQIILIQLLSIVQWHHFAYMVISVAMLGFGSAGTFIALFKAKLIKKIIHLLPVFLFISSAAIAAVFYIIQIEQIRFDSMLLFAGDYQFLKLLGTYLLLLIPFFFGAAVIGLVFVKYVNEIGKLYFSNLLGSGIGGLTVLFLMWKFSPAQLPAIISFLPLLGGILLIRRKTSGFLFAAGFIAAVIAVYSFLSPPELKLSEFKSISRVLNLPDTEIIESRNSPYGLTEAVISPAIRYAPGLSLNYTGDISAGAALFNNGDWGGPILTHDSSSVEKQTGHFLLSGTSQLPFVLGKRSKVLVLNAGTGVNVLHALLNNASLINAIEVNEVIVEMINGFSDSKAKVNTEKPPLKIYDNQKVSVKNLTARTYLLSDTAKYDLIIMPTIDAFGGTSGLYSLQEQYHLTVESFTEMLNKLSDGGLISISTYIDYPYRNPLKILATIVEALEHFGASNPLKQLAAIKNWNAITFIIKQNVFKDEENEIIRNFCGKMSFDPIILHNIEEQERDRFNRLQDENLYKMIDKILSSHPEREKLYEDYDFNIQPATDDKPYFSQFIRWKSLAHLRDTFGTGSFPFLEVGYLILYVTFFQILLAAILLIILPLFRIGWKGGGKLRTLLYFSGLGLGYMFVEIVFIQRFTLYFGSPVYAASAVISLMLISSGAGSYLTQRFNLSVKTFTVVLGAVILLLLLNAGLLNQVIRSTIGYNEALKMIIAFLMITPLAFIMGMPFPLGLRKLSSSSENYVPWAWGINGCVSVISAVLATIIAVESGFLFVMIGAAIAYAIALSTNIKLN